LEHREVTSGEMPVEVVHVRDHLEPGVGGERLGVDAGAGDSL
jgi:hypothetical protein